MKVLRNILNGSLIADGIPEKNIFQADNGKSALNIMKTNNINLIISDWNMPEMNGLQFLHVCKADEKYKHLPFIMLTSEAEKEKIVEAMSYDITGYLLKPIQKDLLFLKITSVFG